MCAACDPASVSGQREHVRFARWLAGRTVASSLVLAWATWGLDLLFSLTLWERCCVQDWVLFVQGREIELSCETDWLSVRLT